MAGRSDKLRFATLRAGKGFASSDSPVSRPASATCNPRRSILIPCSRKIASSGLQFFGVHIFLLQYDEKTHIAPAELCEKVCRTGAAPGAQRLILSGVPASTDDDLARKVEVLHNVGAVAKSSE